MGERGDLGKYLGNLNFKQVPTCDFVGGGPQSCHPVIDRVLSIKNWFRHDIPQTTVVLNNNMSESFSLLIWQ